MYLSIIFAPNFELLLSSFSASFLSLFVYVLLNTICMIGFLVGIISLLKSY